MRDPTRGGFAAVLHELAAEAKCGALIDEAKIPVSPAVQALCEMLGFDPLHIACEGRVVAICDPSVCDDVLRKWRSLSEGRVAVCVGNVTSDEGRIVLDTLASGKRIVDVPEGELLPRIC